MICWVQKLKINIFPTWTKYTWSNIGVELSEVIDSMFLLIGCLSFIGLKGSPTYCGSSQLAIFTISLFSPFRGSIGLIHGVIGLLEMHLCSLKVYYVSKHINNLDGISASSAVLHTLQISGDGKENCMEYIRKTCGKKYHLTTMLSMQNSIWKCNKQRCGYADDIVQLWEEMRIPTKKSVSASIISKSDTGGRQQMRLKWMDQSWISSCLSISFQCLLLLMNKDYIKHCL